MTQTAPAGWYPDPESPEQQRYWDGTAWTQDMAPTLASSPTAESGAPSGESPPAPVLEAWKTSVGFSVLGLIPGFLLFVFLGTLVAMPLMMLTAMLGGSEEMFPQLSGMVGNIVMFVYAVKFYPSYFTDKPLLRSSKAISFANFMFGGLIFGLLWNGNLSKKTKGISYIVAAVLSAGIWMPIAVRALITWTLGGLLMLAS